MPKVASAGTHNTRATPRLITLGAGTLFLAVVLAWLYVSGRVPYWPLALVSGGISIGGGLVLLATSSRGASSSRRAALVPLTLGVFIVVSAVPEALGAAWGLSMVLLLGALVALVASLVASVIATVTTLDSQEDA
jgi:hypothetical protein